MPALRVLLYDVALVTIATILALLLRSDFAVSKNELAAFVPYLVSTFAFAVAVLPALGVSRAVWRFTSMRDYLAIAMGAAMIIVGALALTFVINRLDGIARSLPILQWLLVVALLVAARIAARIRHTRRDASVASPMALSSVRETIVVVGLNKLAELYLHYVREFAADRATVVGILDADAPEGRSLLSRPVLGRPDDIAKVVRNFEVHGVFVNRVVVTVPFVDLTPAAQNALRELDASTPLALDLLHQRMEPNRSSAEGATCSSPELGISDGKQAFTLPDDVKARKRGLYWWIKRTADLLGAVVLLIVLWPVIALVSALVALDIGLPVMFWQQRPGLGGRPFRVYKFRTMGPAYDGCGRRRSDVERVSKLGAFLRRTRLDELPQLFSILFGHMSFIGPRPLLPVDQPADCSARLLVRPGLTGWAQIKGGRAISARDKAALDVWYVNNVSFALDVKIMLGTVPIVLFGERVTERAIAQAWRELQAAGICSADHVMEQPVCVLSRP